MLLAAGLDGNAREFVPARRPSGDREQPAFLDAALPRTLRVRRPCRYTILLTLLPHGHAI